MPESYAQKTFADDSPVKRFFQRSRLEAALRLAAAARDPHVIVDFGAGNGELCKALAARFPAARIICYEPHPELLQQARENLAGTADIAFTGGADELPDRAVDLLFCLEVFEHLPQREFGLAMAQIRAALHDEGLAVFGVPIETGLPALYKGMFRAARRFGAFDARPRHILSALFGRPPRERPTVELIPGSWYHLEHLGFDHREFRAALTPGFEVLDVSTSPFPIGGAALNAEANFLVRERRP